MTEVCSPKVSKASTPNLKHNPNHNPNHQSKSTLIDKLKDYQKMNTTDSFYKTTLLSTQKLSKTMKRSKQVQAFLSSDSYELKTLMTKMRNKYQQRAQSPKQILVLESVVDKWSKQNQKFQQQIQKNFNCIRQIQDNISKQTTTRQSQVRENYLQLQNLQKQAYKTQKQLQQQNIQVNECIQLAKNYTQKKIQQTRSKQINHKTIINEQLNKISKQQIFQLHNICFRSSELKQQITIQQQQSQNEWCHELDRINQYFVAISNQLNQLKYQDQVRYHDNRWKLKDMQIRAKQAFDDQRSQRVQNQAKIHKIVSKLIDRVGVI